MKISVLTMCPEFFDSFLNSVLVARGAKRDLLNIEIVDIRSFAGGSFRHIDDSPYGGGAGMIMCAEPVVSALESVLSENSHTVLFAPSGNPYTQQKAHEYSEKDHLILICGHYEGIDARVYPYCDELLSIGDYVLSGGEIAAMAVIDSVVKRNPLKTDCLNIRNIQSRAHSAHRRFPRFCLAATMKKSAAGG